MAKLFQSKTLKLYRDSPTSRQQTTQRRSEPSEDSVHNKAEEDGDGWNDEVEQKQCTYVDGKVQRGEQYLADIVHDEGVEGKHEEAAPCKHCTGSCLARLNQICGDTDDGDDAQDDASLVDEDVVFPSFRQGVGNG